LNAISKILVFGLVAFFFTNQKIHSQTLIDSLYSELNSNKDVQIKLDFLKDASYKLLITNPDTIVYYSNYALKLCEQTNNLQDKADFLGLLGEAHQRKSNYSEALKYTFEACKICEKLNDRKSLASNYNTIGSIYRVSGKLEEALNFYNKALTIRETEKDSAAIAGSYNNIGIVYMIKAEYDTGMAFWGKSLAMKLAIGDSLGASTTMGNMAMYYRDIGETEKALDYFNHVIRIKKSVNDYSSIAINFQNIGELYIKQNEFKKGLDYYNQSLEQAKLSRSKQLMSFSYLLLAKTYYANQNYQIAYDNYMLYANLKDSVFNESTAKNLDEIESKYENEKKAILIESLEKEKIAQNEKQTLIIISSVIGFLAMFIIILIVFKNYRQKKKDHSIISDQKNILFEKNREITDSITYAKRLQDAILPPAKLIEEKLPNSFIVFQPKDVVSGDFYWLEPLNGKIIFAVADCTGHGVPGAMVSVVCSNALNRAVKEFKLTEPAKILDKVRSLVIETFRYGEQSEEISIEEIKDGMDISLCLLDPKTNELEYAGANNPLWILRKEVNEMEEVKANKQPIGVYHDNNKPFTNHKVKLSSGDAIYLFSDGFADQFGGEKGKKLKYKPFKNILISLRNKSLADQKNFLITEFENWKGEMEQIDDVCIMSVKI
jgi:serine phosphatase RsbU (regulator of sigma subunit)/tetratricopeptide (TPR) repeat protein